MCAVWNKLQYPLCRQTVTLYHADPAAGTVTRTVLRGVFYDCRRRETAAAASAAGADPSGAAGTAFLLVIPAKTAVYGQDYTLAVHDRVFDGEGPELAYSDWADFTPAKVPGLAGVQYVDPKTMGGVPCHLEAGGWWSRSGSGAHSLT